MIDERGNNTDTTEAIVVSYMSFHLRDLPSAFQDCRGSAASY